MDIKVVLKKDENSWSVATVPALPGCISQGTTEREALSNIREAIELHVRALAGDCIPLYGSKAAKEHHLSVQL